MLAFIHDNFKLDLTYLNVTFTEINQWFKDDFSTEQSIPFTLYLDTELSKNSGFELHYNSNSTQTVFEGYLEKDGELKAAVLTFLSSKGKYINAIINAGTDNFPSFDKKLSELPLETKPTNDIAAEALTVIQKGYPETNYNFPMVHTDKYDPTSDDWNGFEKIINNYSVDHFISNELAASSNLDLIKNIMQPLPYLMHILKAGVAASGKTLAGDILTDYDLNRALVFRDGDYYNAISKNDIPVVYKNNEYDSLAYVDNTFQYVTFSKQITITQKGDYVLLGSIQSLEYTARKNPAWSHDRYRCSKRSISIVKISQGVTTNISGYYLDRDDDGTSNLQIDIKTDSYDIPVSFNVGDVLKITKTEPKRDGTPSPTPDYPEAISLKLIPVRLRNPDGSPIISVLNLNDINLSKVVPDMTFRDLVTIIKNWKNYEFIPDGDFIYMNRITKKLNRSEAKNINVHDVEEPERDYHEDREYELSFTDGKANATYQYDSVLVTKSGMVVNGTSKKDTLNPIKIDALPLPVVTRNGITTALSFEDDTSKLRLVFMNPMPSFGTPVSVLNENMLIPKVYESDYKDWLHFRINSKAWTWNFIISVEAFREISIQTLTYAYANYHIFSEIEKERINSMFWRITAKTESLV